MDVIDLGLFVIISLDNKFLKSVFFSKHLLRSPSVIIPTKVLSVLHTAVAPSLFLEISIITSLISTSSLTKGLFIFIKSLTFKVSFFPSIPPGWNLAKSCLENPFVLINILLMHLPILAVLL